MDGDICFIYQCLNVSPSNLLSNKSHSNSSPLRTAYGWKTSLTGRENGINHSAKWAADIFKHDRRLGAFLVTSSQWERVFPNFPSCVLPHLSKERENCKRESLKVHVITNKNTIVKLAHACVRFNEGANEMWT